MIPLGGEGGTALHARQMLSPPVNGLAAGVVPLPASRNSSLTPLDGVRPMPATPDPFAGAGIMQPHGSRGTRTGSANARPSLLSNSGRIASASTVQGNNLSEADNIKVAVRVRPLFPHETERGGTPVVQVGSSTTVKVVVPGPAGTTMQRDFAFHACLGPEVGQADVMALCGVPQLLEAALAGYNVTVFAYGQTGSGKTYTMSGREEVISSDSYTGDLAHDGIVTRSIQHLFGAMEGRKGEARYAVSASYLEIYNEGIYDLLNLKANKNSLPVKWDAATGFFVPGLKQVSCAQVDTALEVIGTGMKHRHVGSHELNIESSRSHSIMTLAVHTTPTDPAAADYGTPRLGKISFVDLAGSERLKDSRSEGAMLKETANINKSLFVLGKVISALAERDSSGTSSAHIPYRDSKLTKLLMDSLGGSALALMVACCSPASTALEETLSTLSYATRAKNIQNRPTVQYDPKEAQMATLRREIELLRQENCYLREQVRAGGGGTGIGIGAAVHSDLGTPLHSARSAWPPGSAGGMGVGEGGAAHAPPGHPAWPSILGQQADCCTGGSRDGSWDSARGDGGGGGAAAGLPPQPPRLVTPRVGAVPDPGGLRGSGATSPAPGYLEPLRMSAEASSSFSAAGVAGGGGGGGVGAVLARRLSHAGPGSGPVDDDLMRRLMETQNLLARFSDENGRLAKENDRLRAGRQLLSQEHGEVLDEIDTLRSKLTQLESAVRSGAQTPTAIKAALQTAISGGGGGGGGAGSGASSARTSLLAQQSAASEGGGGVGGYGSPPLSTGAGGGGVMAAYGISPHALPGAGGSGAPAGYPQQQQQQLWSPAMPGGQGHMSGGPMAGPQPPPYSPQLYPVPPGSSGPGGHHPHPHPQYPQQQQGYGQPQTQQPGGQQPGMGGYGATTMPGSANPALHQLQYPNASQAPNSNSSGGVGGVANVMAVASGAATAAAGNAVAMRTRTKYGNGGGGGGDDSIIVADRAKLALLLGDGPIEPAVPMRPVPIKPPEPSYANAAKAHHVQHIQKQLQRGGSNPPSPTGPYPGG